MGPLLWLIILVLDIIAIADVVKKREENLKKVLWIILIIVLPFAGMILYFLLRKK